MIAGLPATIALWAGGATVLGFLIITVGSNLFGKQGQGRSLAAGLKRLRGAIIVSVAGFALLGAPVVAGLMLLSQVLIELPTPRIVYLLSAALSLFGLWRGYAHSGYGMEGCTKAIFLCWSAYGLAWSAASLALLPDNSALAWSIAALVRPLATAAIPALLVYRHSAKSKRLAQGIGFFLVVAAFSAMTFFPIEKGAGAAYLPAPDLVRFPLVGAVAVAALLSLPQLVQVLADMRSPAGRSRGRKMARRLQPVALGALFGALLGLVWAVTRIIQNAL